MDQRESVDPKECAERMIGRIALVLLGASIILAMDVGFSLSGVK